MYTLDFETMKQVMQEHQKTGLLYSDVPASTSGIRQPCRVEIKLMAGSIVSCSVVSKNGQRFSEKEATKKISRMGPLFWTFVPQTVPTLPALPPPARQAQIFFPQQTVRLEQEQMSSWPRLYRRVFALADGTRSVAKIAETLSVPQDLVDKVLLELQLIGVIATGPFNRENRW